MALASRDGGPAVASGSGTASGTAPLSRARAKMPAMSLGQAARSTEGTAASATAVDLLPVPVLADVLAAAQRIRPHLLATPLLRHPAIEAAVGTEVWVKHENHLPTGAFKVRGGINLVSQLSADELRRGVIAASTGNHGQSVAYAAHLLGAPAAICVPEGANPGKVDAMARLGAELIVGGRDFDEARESCAVLARERGMRYIHSGDEPHLIAGVATSTLEMLAHRPDIEVIIVPIGGGSGAAGACIVAKAVRPDIEVIGVQSAQAPAAFLSWREGCPVDSTTSTIAEGLATRTAFALPQRILRALLDDFVLVDDADILRACLTYLEGVRQLVEPAGAASLAAAIKLAERLRSRRVAIVCSGGNVSIDQLRAIVQAEAPE